MIDLHTHTIFSDGVLVPAELVRRAVVAGYSAIAITDHADHTNLDFIVPRIAAAAEDLGVAWGMTVLAGIELTHLPPAQIDGATRKARSLGASIIVCHGETIVEPVQEGTNRAAIEAGVDILSHPGLITDEDAMLAAEKGVYLEITTRGGHSLCNGHVALQARSTGAMLVINNDAHAPGDLVSAEMSRNIALGAGLSEEEIMRARRNSEELVKRSLSVSV